MMAHEDLSLWSEHIADSGRRFLSNRNTGETKWLWQKWDLNGQLYCENVRTKERLWQRDMMLAQKVETGVASQSEISAFMNEAGPPSPTASQALQLYQQQQHQASLSGAYYATGNDVAHQYPHQQFAGQGHPTNGQVAHLNPGGHPPYSAAAIAAGVAQANGAVNGHHFGQQHVPPATLALAPQMGYNGDSYIQQSLPPVHQIPPEPTQWNQTSYQASEPQRELLVQLPDDFQSNPQDARPSGAGQHWSTSSNALTSQSVANHARSFRQGPSHNAISVSEKALNAKRSAEIVYNQHGKGRFWHNDNNMNNPKRSKFSDTRNNSSDIKEWIQFNPKSISKTNTRSPVRSTFRPKPAPLVPDAVAIRRRESKFRATSTSAIALLRASTCSFREKVALMHDRDFPLDTKESQNPDTVRYDGFDEEEFDCDPVIGICQTVEKDFLRLTSAPKPADVRPPEILKKALKNVKSRWKYQQADYDWVCRQLKSIRQDYKVQHVDTSDTLDAYETHARLALENGDLGEFNTCVAQAQSLYEKVERAEIVKDEFCAYRVLYNLLVGASEWEHSKLLTQFSVRERKRVATHFALDVRQAFLSNNYHLFFALCANTPPRTMVSFLLDLLAPVIRSRALATFAVAYGPTALPCNFILVELGWKDPLDYDDEMGSDSSSALASLGRDKAMEKKFKILSVRNEPVWVKNALSFLIGINGVFEVAGNGAPRGINGVVLNCKATKQKGVLISGQKGLITHAGSNSNR